MRFETTVQRPVGVSGVGLHSDTPLLGALQTQFYWNVNLTMDQKREPWANFFETGPGVRFRVAAMPSSLYLTVNYLRGNYTVAGDPYGPTFNDLRAGFWYAFTH